MNTLTNIITTQAQRCAEVAPRSLGLNLQDYEPHIREAIRLFIVEVEARAEDKMLKTSKLEGAHYAAMKELWAETKPICPHCGKIEENEHQHRGCRLKATFPEAVTELGDGFISIDVQNE